MCTPGESRRERANQDYMPGEQCSEAANEDGMLGERRREPAGQGGASAGQDHLLAPHPHVATMPPAAFGAWLRATVATLQKDVPADVPCGECNVCCRTFHQIHLRPDEKRARGRLPKGCLTTAPGLPPGYLLLGYTEAGSCPVLIDGRCTIYEDRPLVCRTYDCRMYAATGVEPDRAEIAAQVRRWRFGYPHPADRELHDAVLAAVAFKREHPSCLRSDAAREQPIRIATLAVAAHDRFLPGATCGRRRRPVTDRDRLLAVAVANEELFGDG